MGSMKIVRIPPARYNDVIMHLRKCFYPDEPLNKALNLFKSQDHSEELEEHTYSDLKDDVSFMALTEDDKIAGVLLNSISKKGDDESALASLSNFRDDRLKKIFQLMIETNIKADLFNKLHVDKMFNTHLLSVQNKYRNLGVGNKLLAETTKLSREFDDINIIKTDCTSAYTQRMVNKSGFIIAADVKYDSYLDKDGKPIFKPEPPHERYQLLYKYIDKDAKS